MRFWVKSVAFCNGLNIQLYQALAPFRRFFVAIRNNFYTYHFPTIGKKSQLYQALASMARRLHCSFLRFPEMKRQPLQNATLTGMS